MATFSTNQVRQLYVANTLEASGVDATNPAGSISVHADNDSTCLYFKHMGAGGLNRSDLIEVKNIISAKATDADDLARDLVKYKLVLDPTINSGAPVGGEDYILRIAFRNYIGISEEDQYFKYGTVHTYSAMTASDFYRAMALSVVNNFSKAEEGTLKVYLEDGGTDPAVEGTTTEVTKGTKEADYTDTYTGIIVEEAPQDWILGVMEQVPVNFTLQPTQIISNSDERIWGIVNKVASTDSIPDGKKIADLEYFCMGERGDQYRNVGWPHVIRTKYLVDPETKYNVIDIHYAFVDGGVNVQKSEKDITIVVPKVGASNSVSNVLTNSIITAINTATGLAIDTLDVSA